MSLSAFTPTVSCLLIPTFFFRYAECNKYLCFFFLFCFLICSFVKKGEVVGKSKEISCFGFIYMYVSNMIHFHLMHVISLEPYKDEAQAKTSYLIINLYLKFFLCTEILSSLHIWMQKSLLFSLSLFHVISFVYMSTNS